jgi:hypothetical protein
MVAQTALVEGGAGSYRFTFESARGELSGRVIAAIESPPDRRSYEDREQAAKDQIRGPLRGLPFSHPKDL